MLATDHQLVVLYANDVFTIQLGECTNVFTRGQSSTPAAAIATSGIRMTGGRARTGQSVGWSSGIGASCVINNVTIRLQYTSHTSQLHRLLTTCDIRGTLYDTLSFHKENFKK